MEKKVKTNEIPFHAHSLYIKLYCDKKGKKSKKTIQEAKKSWIDLSPSKKKQFFRVCHKGNLLKIAHNLCKSKTYLKRKKLNNCDIALIKSERKEDVILATTQNNNGTLENASTLTLDSSMAIDYDNRNDSTVTVRDTDFNQEINIRSPTPSNHSNRENLMEDVINDELYDPQDNRDYVRSPTLCDNSNSDARTDVLSTHNSNSNQESIAPVEPTPPTVKLGKDLFEMLKGPGDGNWLDLTKRERNHYNSAVRTLKRQYIKKYTIYLESLNQRQLFDHYVKTIRT